MTRQRHCNDISLPVPILSFPHPFSARFLMIQTALCCQPFLWADAARIPLCIAILSLLPAGLSITDGIVKKQIWVESGRTSYCQSMLSLPIRWEHSDKNLSSACRSCHSMHNNPCLYGKNKTLRGMTILAMNLYEMWCYLANMCNQNLNILLKEYFSFARVHVDRFNTATLIISWSRVHNNVTILTIWKQRCMKGATRWCYG